MQRQLFSVASIRVPVRIDGSYEARLTRRAASVVCVHLLLVGLIVKACLRDGTACVQYGLAARDDDLSVCAPVVTVVSLPLPLPLHCSSNKLTLSHLHHLLSAATLACLPSHRQASQEQRHAFAHIWLRQGQVATLHACSTACNLVSLLAAQGRAASQT